MTTAALTIRQAPAARGLLRALKRTHRSRRGVVALEFALVVPVLVAVAVGVFDLANGFIVWRRLTQAAQSVDEIATAMAVQFDGSNNLTRDQATTASTAAFAIMPNLANTPASSFGVTMSTVVFSATHNNCMSNCSYVANTAWSVTLQGTQPTRACGTLKAVSDTQPPSLSTLPTDVFGPTSLLVVDMSFRFEPAFIVYFTGPFTLMRSAYLPPRAGTLAQWIRFVDPTGTVVPCPGYT